MGVVICNTLIGTFQEIRAKKTIDKLSLIAAPKARVVRSGEEQGLPVEELVLDDILHLSAGNQVCADCIVQFGECEVNESLLTGESDPVVKNRAIFFFQEVLSSAETAMLVWNMLGRRTMLPKLQIMPNI